MTSLPQSAREWAIRLHQKGFSLIPLRGEEPHPDLCPQKIDRQGQSLWLDEAGNVLTTRTDHPKRTWKIEESLHPHSFALSEVMLWFDNDPLCNYGVRTGAISGIVVLSCNSEAAYRQLLRRGLPRTSVVKSAHGYDLYLGYNAHLKDLFGKDVTVKSDGKYVVGPGCISADRTAYQWFS